MAFPSCIRDFNATLYKTLKITGESHCTKFRGLPETWLTQRKWLEGQIAMENCHPCPPPNERKCMKGRAVWHRPLRKGLNSPCTHNNPVHMTFEVSVQHI